jgi:hypothetical protein
VFYLKLKTEKAASQVDFNKAAPFFVTTSSTSMRRVRMGSCSILFGPPCLNSRVLAQFSRQSLSNLQASHLLFLGPRPCVTPAAPSATPGGSESSSGHPPSVPCSIESCLELEIAR